MMSHHDRIVPPMQVLLSVARRNNPVSPQAYPGEELVTHQEPQQLQALHPRNPNTASQNKVHTDIRYAWPQARMQNKALAL